MFWFLADNSQVMEEMLERISIKENETFRTDLMYYNIISKYGI